MRPPTANASMVQETVAAIIVSYNPEPAQLAQRLERIAAQVDYLVLVDNASRPSLRAMLTAQADAQGAVLLKNDDNLGLAAGQRQGIETALALGATFTLLLDQDSLPAPDLVARLLAAYHRLSAEGRQIAGVGPRVLFEPAGRAMPFIRFKPYAALKGRCQGADDLIRTDFLISSGLLTPAWVYASVGLPEDALFIDNIDLEWCFRARHRGFDLYGVCDAVLHHQIGKQTRFLSARHSRGPIHIHDPVRQYYQTRNRFLLYGRHYVPWAWKIQDFPRALFKLLYFGLVIPPRREHLRMMGLALWDALRGVTGTFRHDR